MSEMRRWHRFVLWLIARLDALLPDAPDECGLLARSGDVYCTLPEDHDGLHGWDQPWTQHPEPMRPEPGAYADAAGSSRAFEAMRREVGSLRDDALVKERKYADLWGAAEPNGWTNHVAAYDEVLAVIDELEELS